MGLVYFKNELKIFSNIKNNYCLNDCPKKIVPFVAGGRELKRTVPE